MRRIKERLQNIEEGATLVEFALISMILLTVTFGMIDFSRAVYASSVIRAAAQEGARAGIVDGATTADITQAVQDKLIGLPNTGTTIVTAVLNGSIQRVSVSYDFNFVTPFLPATPLNLASTATMVIQPSISLP